MAQSEAVRQAQEVQGVAERIRHALLRAHRRIYRAAVRRRPGLGTGHPTARDEAETSLGQRLYTDSYRDLVVLGFWYDGLKSPKYVCSTSGISIIRAVRKVAGRTLELANNWRAKGRSGVYHDFLREARKLAPDLQELDPESGALVDRHELDMLRMRQTLGVAFAVTEAEARMASHLMRHDVNEVVHLYGTASPCGGCSRTYAVLAPHRDRVLQQLPSFQPNGAPQKAPGPEIAGLRWRVGWVCYGRPYQATTPAKATDLRALDEAVRLGSIEGHSCV
jgi:hypothetical protein